MGKLDSIEFLKIRILVSLLKMSPENCNVTNLSKTLGVEKYTVSRRSEEHTSELQSHA